MEHQSINKLPVYFAAPLLVAVSLVFLVELLSYRPNSESDTTPVNPDAVAALVQNSDAANGSQLIEGYGCIACHRLGVENGVAPPFVGIAERAEQRHPHSMLLLTFMNPSLIRWRSSWKATSR